MPLRDRGPTHDTEGVRLAGGDDHNVEPWGRIRGDLQLPLGLGRLDPSAGLQPEGIELGQTRLSSTKIAAQAHRGGEHNQADQNG